MLHIHVWQILYHTYMVCIRYVIQTFKSCVGRVDPLVPFDWSYVKHTCMIMILCHIYMCDWSSCHRFMYSIKYMPHIYGIHQNWHCVGRVDPSEGSIWLELYWIHAILCVYLMGGGIISGFGGGVIKMNDLVTKSEGGGGRESLIIVHPGVCLWGGGEDYIR